MSKILGSNFMVKVSSLWLLTTILLASFQPAQAQQPGKMPRIGFLVASSQAAAAARVAAFRDGLRQLGYVEEKNLAIEFRFAEGKLDRVPSLAAELVRSQVDVIVTAGARDTRAAKEATNRIPIVMASDTDPIGSGHVASLARPGANITGLSTLSPELSGKQLELLKEIVSRLARVAVVETSTEPGNALAHQETELAAKEFGIQLQFLAVRDSESIESAFRTASKGRAEAVLMLGSPVFNSNRAQITDLAVKSRLPAIYRTPEFVDAGGPMCYGANIADLFRRAATYVDKILKGRQPADLPVEQPIKFEFIVNLKAAKQIGLTIPPNVLVRADRVIR